MIIKYSRRGEQPSRYYLLAKGHRAPTVLQEVKSFTSICNYILMPARFQSTVDDIFTLQMRQLFSYPMGRKCELQVVLDKRWQRDVSSNKLVKLSETYEATGPQPRKPASGLESAVSQFWAFKAYKGHPFFPVKKFMGVLFCFSVSTSRVGSGSSQ